MATPICCLCGGQLRFWGVNPDEPCGYGNNPAPLSDSPEDRCCDLCNYTEVIPARLRNMYQARKGSE